MENDPISNGSSAISASSQNVSDPPLIMLTLPISTKLDRDNYLSWQSQIVPLLHAYGLYRFLEITTPPSATILTDTGSTQTNPAYLPWYKQDQMLLGWLRASLTREILALSVSAKTSADLWHNLRRSFSATSRARLSELRRKLQSTNKGGVSCLEYVQKMQSIADELAFIGEPVSDDDLQMYLLQGLSSEFDSLVIAVQTAPPRSVADLTALIYGHESRLLLSQTSDGSSLPSSQNPTALYTAKSGPPSQSRSNRGGGHYRSRGGGNQQQHFSKPNNGPRPNTSSSKPNRLNPNRDTICQICTKRGHRAVNCWYRSDLNNYPEQVQPQAHLTNPVPFQANSAQTAKPSAGPDWWLDSGASHHVTNDLNNLTSYLPYEGLDKLHIGSPHYGDPSTSQG